MSVPADIRRYLAYDRETGHFTWLLDMRGPKRAGDRAGTLLNGAYISIAFRGKRYLAHRLAWWFVNGEMPKDKIDHQDRDGLNNRFGNLRDCSHSQNMRNRVGCTKPHSTGFKGVTFHKKSGRFRADIVVDRKQHYLGLFDDPEVAAKAYDAAAIMHHGEFARLNFPQEAL